MTVERSKFTAWITKLALTTGIYQTEVEDCFDTSTKKMVRETKTRFGNYFHIGDWHRTREEAVKRAEEMREKKLLSLNKQIVRIKGLDFSK